MLKLGRAQGVSMAAALNRNIPIFEYAPRRIKQSVTGRGTATKEQVAGMVKSLLNLETLHSKFDATDALQLQFVIILPTNQDKIILEPTTTTGIVLSIKIQIKLNS